MQLPISLLVKPSRRLRWLQICAHAIAALTLLPLSLHWLGKIALLLCIAASLRYFLRQTPWLTALHLGEKGELNVTTVNGERELLTLQPDTLLLPGLIVMNLRRQQRAYALVLMADSMTAEAQRQLRIWLRWRAFPAD